jgi:uncharacterized metal-binding protein YceD (DUF177 family)
MSETPELEFSRPVALARLARPRSRHRIAATQAEADALARRFGVLAIENLEGDLLVEFIPGDQVLRVTGRVTALVRQTCIVTLDPVENKVTAELDELFARAADDGKELDLQADDPAGWAEPWPGENLDLGELVAQGLALAIDPYPRKPDGPSLDGPAPATGASHRPFAGLADPGRRGRA